MKTVKINNKNFLEGPLIHDANIEIEITDELFEKTSINSFSCAWQYTGDDFIEVEVLSIDVLKNKRQKECFNLIDNRSPMWYNRLTVEQKKEIDKWYQDWLDVTDTKVIPTKPEWLK